MSSRKRFKANHAVSSVDAIASSETTSIDLLASATEQKIMGKTSKLKAVVRATRSSSKLKTRKDEAMDSKKLSIRKSSCGRKTTLGQNSFPNIDSQLVEQIKVEEQQSSFLGNHSSSMYTCDNQCPCQDDSSNIKVSNLKCQPCEELTACAHSGRIEPDKDVAMPSTPGFMVDPTSKYRTVSIMNVDRNFNHGRGLDQNRVLNQCFNAPDNLQKLASVLPCIAWDQDRSLFLQNWKAPEFVNQDKRFVINHWNVAKSLPIMQSLNPANGFNTQESRSLCSAAPISRPMVMSSFSSPSSELVMDSRNPGIILHSITPSNFRGYNIAAQPCGTNREALDLVPNGILDSEGMGPKLSTSTVRSEGQSTLHGDKRKQRVPLVPWHAIVAQSSAPLTITRSPEFRWASATNCLPERGEDATKIEDDMTWSIEIAGRRLKLTGRLMQHIVPPLPTSMLKDSSTEGFECGLYTIARVLLGEACAVSRGTCELRPRTGLTDVASHRVSEVEALGMADPHNKFHELRALMGVTERIKQLEIVFQRIQNMPSIVEVRQSVSELDKLRITNRLTRYYCKGLVLDFRANKNQGEQNGYNLKCLSNRSFLQRYVKAVRMPKSLPEEHEYLRL